MLNKNIFLIVLALCVGLVIGVFIPSPLTREAVQNLSQGERESSKHYEYISPLLSCPEVEIDHLGNNEVNTLEQDLLAAIAQAKSKKDVVDVGLYFRQLKGGPWLGINHEAQFYPRSLLKVPLAMAVFKEAESNPDLLNALIEFTFEKAPPAQYFGKETMKPGETYSMQDLLAATLVDSDNSAALSLSELLGKNALLKTYSDLGIDAPHDSLSYTTSVRDYASFFRILYNATYVSDTASEYILNLLSEASFTKGLVAGVPKSIKVAHKFGEQNLGQNNFQLHDCGIVYHPVKPYLICVMTTGTDFEKMAQVIASIARVTYDSVSK